MKQRQQCISKNFSFDRTDLALFAKRVPSGKRSLVLQTLLRKFLAGEVTVTMPATEL